MDQQGKQQQQGKDTRQQGKQQQQGKQEQQGTLSRVVPGGDDAKPLLKDVHGLHPERIVLRIGGR